MLKMKAEPARRLVSTVLWQWMQGPSLEHFELFRVRTGWTMHGTIIALGQKGPAIAEYTIRCDNAWRTRNANISLRDDFGVRSLRVKLDRKGWFENGRHKRSLAACTDLDLGWSPSTNTIAIRRLKLSVGARSGPQTAAWVCFPELTVEPLPQEYERLDKCNYRYTSRGGAFRAGIHVDTNGLVIEYEGFWRRATR
jgi:hypothetical protein